MERSEWLRIPADELPKYAPFTLRVVPTTEALYDDFAMALYDEIGAAAGRNLLLVVPLGPRNHYPRLAERINREQLSLSHVGRGVSVAARPCLIFLDGSRWCIRGRPVLLSRAPLEGFHAVLLVGDNFTGERQTSIETQVRNGDKRGALGLVSKIEAAHNTSLVTGIADPGDCAGGGGLTRSVLRDEGGAQLGCGARGQGQSLLQLAH